MTALIDAREDERDRGLVERHQAGDSTAFAELYALHYGRLIRFCRRLVRDPHVAEEIAQDAFLRAFTTLDRLGGERRFYPWLTVIARRLVIDHVRRHGRVQPRSDVEQEHAGAAEDVAVERIEGTQLLTALDRVRDRHREVLHLRDWEGLSYEAIAERLGVAPTAVPPLLHRARAALRREYLLVTEGRVAAFLPLTAVMAAMRRMRDRLTQLTAWIPDPSGMSAPVAGVVLSLGTLAASLSGHATQGSTAEHPPGHEVVEGQIDSAADQASIEEHTGPSWDAMETGGVGESGSEAIVPGVAEGSVTQPDPDGVRRVKEEGRNRPVYFHNPYIGFSWDPADDQRRVQEKLEGITP